MRSERKEGKNPTTKKQSKIAFSSWTKHDVTLNGVHLHRLIEFIVSSMKRWIAFWIALFFWREWLCKLLKLSTEDYQWWTRGTEKCQEIKSSRISSIVFRSSICLIHFYLINDKITPMHNKVMKCTLISLEIAFSFRVSFPLNLMWFSLI